MDRRTLLRKLSAISLYTGLIGNASGEESGKYPSIRGGYLDEYNWVEAANPSIPNELPSEKIEDSSRWKAVEYVDDHITPTVYEQTDGVIDTQLMSMVAVRASNLDYLFSPDSELDETLVGIDGVAEEICEEIILSEMDSLDTYSDFHIKTVAQSIELTVGQLPYAGELLSSSLGYLWDTPQSINTRNGVTAYLAQYLATKTLEVNGAEYEVDYRGLYADWFYDEDLYAVIAFYPQDKETLSEAILELTGVNSNIDDSITFEDEVIQMLGGVGD